MFFVFFLYKMENQIFRITSKKLNKNKYMKKKYQNSN